MLWKRLSAFAVLAWIMACGCSLGTPPNTSAGSGSKPPTPTSNPIILPPTQSPAPIKTNTPFPSVTPPPPTQRPANTAIPLPVIPNRGSYGNSCVVMPINAGDTVNVRIGAGTNYGVVALLQTWAVIITSQGSWYAIELPRGLTAYDVGWVSNTVTKVSAGCYAPTPMPTENTTCRFIVGGGASNVALYLTPNGSLGPTVPTQTLNVLAMQSNWIQVISTVTGQWGWLPDNMGYLLGNCGSVPQLTPPPPDDKKICTITIGADSPVYSSPNVASTDMIKKGAVIQAIVRTNSGWYGYLPGLTVYTAQVDLAVLLWVPYGNPLGNANTGTVGCDALPIVAS